jgi:hypothetical protein
VLDAHGRDVCRRRHQIVHQGGGQQLSGRVVGQFFEDGIANALRHSPLDLALDDLVIQDDAAVFDHIILFQTHQSGLRVDADDGHVRPVAKNLVGRIIGAGERQTGLYGLG